MADNSSVLGQEPIPSQEVNKPILETGQVAPISKQRFTEIAKTIPSQGNEARNLNLPQGISRETFQERIGPYAPVEGYNISEAIAQQQSGWGQVGVLVPRAAAKAATEVLKIPGYAVGFAEWAATGLDPAAYGEAFNNGWANALDNANTALVENGLPVYKPESVKNGNIFDNLASTSFWATEGADGVGFLVAMMVPGAALRWLKLGENIAGATKVFSAAEKLAMPGTELAAVAKSAATAAKINDWSSAVINTVFEAATEGVGSFKEYLADNPGDVEGAGMAAKKTFMVNNAILIGPNILNQRWLFNGFKRAAGAAEAVGESGVAKILEKSITDAGIGAFKAPSLVEKVFDIAKGAGKGLVTEGLWEEGMQYAAAEGAKKGINIYNPIELVKEYVSDITADTKGNTEMWSGIVLGGIMGGGMSTYGGIKQAGRETKLASEYHKLLSNNDLNYLRRYKDFAKVDDKGKPIMLPEGGYDIDVAKVIEGGAQNFNNSLLREQAISAFKKGDKESYDYINNIMHFDYMLPWLSLEGGMDLLKKHIKSLASKENEKELEALGVETKNVASIERELMAKAEKFKAIVDSINDTHGMNFKVKPTNGATNIDVAEFSELVKHGKLSSKANMDYSLERIGSVKSELSKLGITTDVSTINNDLVNDLKTKKALLTLDKVEEATADKAIDSIDRLQKAYNNAAQALNDAFDNEKMQKAFNERIESKKEGEAKVENTEAAAEKKERLKYIKDPALQKLHNDFVKIEKFDNINKNIKIWDEESGSTIDIPGRARLVTTRGLIKITYKDADGKTHTMIAGVGEGNAGGGLDLRILKKDEKGKYKADMSRIGVAFLNSATEMSVREDASTNKFIKYSDITIESYKTAEELQKERQIEAFAKYYEAKIDSYKEALVSREEIITSNETLKRLKSELKDALKENRKDLLLAKQLEDGTIVLGKREVKRIMKVYSVVADMQKRVIYKTREIERIKDRNKLNKEKIAAFKEEIAALKTMEVLPFEEIQELILFNQQHLDAETNLVASTQDIIDNTTRLIKNTLIKLRVYRPQLAKILNIDITDNALGTFGMPASDKNEIIDTILLSKIDEIWDESLIGSFIEGAHTISLKMIEARGLLNQYQDILSTQEAALVEHTALMDQFKKDTKEYKTAYEKVYNIYKKSIPQYFKEKDIYNESLVDGKLIEGDNVIDLESYYEDAYNVGNWEIEARHPYKDFDSFLTITSNQEYAGTNEDVMRWFIFVNNFAYKGLESREHPKYAFKTFTYDQISKSENKKLKSDIKFYLGDGVYMSHNDLQDIKDDTEKKRAINKAKNDIKVIIVEHKNTDNISTFTKDGIEHTIKEPGTNYVYSSLGLGTDTYKESGYDRFSSNKFKKEWVKEKLKEDPDINKEDLASQAEDAYINDVEENRAEFLKLRDQLSVSSQILNMSGINRGVKVDTDAETELEDAVSGDLDYGGMKFYLSKPIVNKETGEYKKEEIEINGNLYDMTSGFVYWLHRNNLTVVKPKTLGETGSVDSIFKIFQAIARGKDNSEQARTYLEQALHMLYSSKSDTSKPHRLFFYKARDAKGEVIEGKYSSVFFGDRIIDMQDLADDVNTEDFKEFLRNKYWNFDERLLDSSKHIKNFTEWRVDKNGDLHDIVWKVKGAKDTNGRVITGSGIGGYQAFLFQNNKSGKHANVSKGLVNLAAAPKAKGKEAMRLSVLNPQYVNQSIRTTIRSAKPVAIKTTKTASSKPLPSHMTLYNVITHGKTPVDDITGQVIYDKEKDKLLIKNPDGVNISQFDLNKEDGKEKFPEDYIIVKKIKELIKSGKVSELKNLKIEGTNWSVTITEADVSEPAAESTGDIKIGESIKAPKVVAEKPGTFTTKTYKEVWSSPAVTDEMRKEALDKANGIQEDAEKILFKDLNDAFSGKGEIDVSEIEVIEEEVEEPPFAKEAEDGPYTIEEKAKHDWFIKKYPNVPLEIIPGIIKGNLWGQFLKGSKVLISDIAGEGTTYHEGFHVWNVLFNSPENRLKLYDEVRRRLGDDSLTNREAEEILAEEFRDFMMLGSSYKFNKGEELKKSFFQKILDFIKNIFGIDVRTATVDEIEEAFKKIDEGTFTTPHNRSDETFARRIPGLSSGQKLAYLKDVNYRFFSALLADVNKDGDLIFDIDRDVKDIYEKVFSSYEKEKASMAIAGKIAPAYINGILNNKALFIDSHLLHLTKYGIDLTGSLLIEEEIDEDGAVRNKAEWIESNRTSIKDSMPTPIKLLIAALKNVEIVNKGGVMTYKAVLNKDYFTFSNVEYDKIVNLLHNNLAGITTPGAMMEKLKQMSIKNIPLRTLYRQIGGGMSAEQMSLTKFKLYEQFLTSFSSNKAKAVISTNNNDGSITKSDMVDESKKEVTKAKWRDNAKVLATAKKSKYIKYQDSDYIIDGAAVIKDIDARVDYTEILANLGIEVPLAAIKSEEVKIYLSKLRGSLADYKDIVNIDALYDRDKIRNQKELDNLAKKFAEYTDSDVDLMYYNIDGNMEWSVTRNSHISDITNRLNEHAANVRLANKEGSTEPVVVPGSLSKVKPYNDGDATGNLFNGHSLYWQHADAGNNIDIVTLKGMRSQMGTGNEVSELSSPDYQYMTFDLILNNTIPLRRAADRSLEYGFYAMPTNYTMGAGSFIETMAGYLYDEIVTSVALLIEQRYNSNEPDTTKHSTQFGSRLDNYSKNAQSLRTFDFIFDKEFNEGNSVQSLASFIKDSKLNDIDIAKIRTLADKYIKKNEQGISKAFNNFIKFSINANKENLIKNMLIIKDSNKWLTPGINPLTIADFKMTRSIDGKGRMTDETLNQLLLIHAYNFFVGVEEQHKVFLGDIAGYDSMKSSNKRTTTSASTREKTPNDTKTLELLNNHLPKINGKQHNAVINQVILDTVVDSGSEALQKVSKDYAKMDITDGSMLSTLDFIRGYHGRRGVWTPAQERTYQYEMQLLVLKILKSEELRELAPWATEEMFTSPDGLFNYHTKGMMDMPRFNGEIINPYDINAMGQIPPVKTQGSGYLQNDINLGVHILDKMAVEPMIPSLLKDNELKFMISMITNDIDSVGDVTTKKADRYVNHGSIKDGFKIDDNTLITKISYDDYGSQLDIQEREKGRVTDSSQKVCVYTNNMFDQGVILPQYEELLPLINERDALLNELYERNLINAKEALGLKDSDGRFHVIEDKEKFRKELYTLFTQRQLPDNITEGLDILLDQTNTKLFDLFSDGDKIEQVLLAYIRNKAIKRKVNGEMLVQVANYIYSEDLKFYEISVKKDKILKAEVMIPIPESWNEWVEKIGGIDRLNEKLANGDLDPKAITFTANRIPTADINTIEVFEVKKFLPTYVGARIVLPKEIVAKTSSDFDVDKLSSYFNNMDMTKDGPRYKEYIKGELNSIDQIENRLNEIYEEVLLHGSRIDYLTRPHSSSSLKKLSEKISRPEDYLSSLEKRHGDKFWMATQWWYNNMKADSFWGGKQVLAIAAAANTVNSLEQRYPIEIVDERYNGVFFFRGQKPKDGQNYRSGQRTDTSGADTSDNHAQVMVGAVDVAKDDFIGTLNINKETLGVLLMLNKYGVSQGVSMKSIAKMLTHPVIDEYLHMESIAKSEFMQHNQYVLKNKNWFYEVVGNKEDRIRKLLGIKFDFEYKDMMSQTDSQKTFLATKNRYKYLTDADLDLNDKKTRMQVLDNFLLYKELSWKVNGLNSALRPYASSKFGKTLHGIDDRISDLSVIREGGTFSISDIDAHISETFLDGANNIYEETLSMYGWGALTIKYPRIYKYMNQYVLSDLGARKAADKEKAMKSAKNQFLSFVFAHHNNEDFIKRRYSELMTGPNSLAIRLRKMKGKVSNEALNAMTASIKEYSNELGRKRENDYVYFSNKSNDINEQNIYTAAIEELINSDVKEVADFASDFFEFSIYQNGVGNTPISYTNLLPNQSFMPLMDKLIEKFMQENEKDMDKVMQSFSDQFFRNNLWDKNIVYRHNKTLGEFDDIYKKYTVDKRSNAAKHKYIAVRYNKSDSAERFLDRRQGRKSPVEYLLYKYVGSTGGYNLDYELVGKLGDGMRFKEYYPTLNGSEVKSVLTTNNYEGIIEKKEKGKSIVTTKLTPQIKVEYFKGFWTRDGVAKQEGKVFLFGDNTEDRLNTKHIPYKTQAVIRGLSNSIGIDTKKNRGTDASSYFTDRDFDIFKKQVDSAVNRALGSGKVIVIPEDGIGTGKAMLQSKAPKLFNYLQDKLNKLNEASIKDNKSDLKKAVYRYELDEAERDAPNEKLNGHMRDFLSAIGVKEKAVKAITDKTGTKVPAIAVSKISELTVEVIEGRRNINTLPEEASHFYVAMLDETGGLYKSMFTNIVNYPIYQKVVRMYGGLYKNDEKALREEAMGKLISERIVSGVDKTLNERQKEQSNNWFVKLWQQIRGIFMKTKEDPYARAAYDILTKNTSELISLPIPTQSNVMNKQDVIEYLVNDLDEETADIMRTDYLSMDKDEFNDWVEKQGLNKLGAYWTAGTVSSFYQIPTLEDEWNDLPFTAKGLYKFDYHRTADSAEKAFQSYVNLFGESHVTSIPITDDKYRIKIAIKKPTIAGSVTEQIVAKEDASINNLRELGKAPVQIKADQLEINFDTYFPEDNHLTSEEKIAQMRAIENGEIIISCNF